MWDRSHRFSTVFISLFDRDGGNILRLFSFSVRVEKERAGGFVPPFFPSSPLPLLFVDRSEQIVTWGQPPSPLLLLMIGSYPLPKVL